MNPVERIELAKRLRGVVPWVVGMRVLRQAPTGPPWGHVTLVERNGMGFWINGGPIPDDAFLDLDDYATIGILLGFFPQDEEIRCRKRADGQFHVEPHPRGRRKTREPLGEYLARVILDYAKEGRSDVE